VQVKGKEIAKLIYEWANKNHMHPDDFSMLFADELLDKLENDNTQDDQPIKE
jgi:hypothetical protein